MNLILTIFFIIIININAFGALTVGNIPKTKTGGTTPALQDSIVTELSGNIGINSTNPGSNLDVTGTIRSSGTITGSNLSGANTGDQTISDATISTTDITTNNASTSKHGFTPKYPNDATKYLDGTGLYSTPAGSGTINSGTVSRSARYSGATTLDSSTKIFDDGTNVGIGTISPLSAIELGVRVLNVSGSNIGIGTAAPTGKLEIEGGNVGIGTAFSDNAALTVIGGNVGIGTWKPISILNLPAGVPGITLGGQVAAPNGGIITTGNVAIGTNITTAALYVTSATAGTQGVFRNTGAQAANAGAGMVGLQDDATAMTVGNRLGFYIFGGSENTTHTVGNGGSISGYANGTWTTSSIPTYLTFDTAPSGSTTRSERMRIDSTGNVSIGSVVTPAASLEIIGNVGIGTVRVGDNFITTSPPSGGMVIEGNVGIGSYAPQSTLVLGGVGHFGSIGTAPTVANNDCGSTVQGTVTAGSTDLRGSVTAGTLNVTSCAITFTTVFGRAPVCLTQDDTNILGVKNTQTTSKLTITSTTSMSSDVVSWICIE